MINDIKQILTRLGNILTNKERNKMTKELYELLKRINNTNRNTRLRKKKQKENLLKWLIEQFKSLAKKEQYMLNNYDDVQYQGISDIKHIHLILLILIDTMKQN